MERNCSKFSKRTDARCWGVRQVCGTHTIRDLKFFQTSWLSRIEEHGAKGLFSIGFWSAEQRFMWQDATFLWKLKEWLPANFASLFVRYTERQIGKVTFALPPQATPETSFSLFFKPKPAFTDDTFRVDTLAPHESSGKIMWKVNFNHVSQMATSLAMRVGN